MAARRASTATDRVPVFIVSFSGHSQTSSVHLIQWLNPTTRKASFYADRHFRLGAGSVVAFTGTGPTTATCQSPAGERARLPEVCKPGEPFFHGKGQTWQADARAQAG